MTDAYHMKKVILNDQRLVFKIVRPNELLSIIRNYTFQKYQDGHLYAIEELRWISPGGVGYGVMISSDNEEHTEPYMYVTVKVYPEFHISCPMGIQKNIHRVEDGGAEYNKELDRKIKHNKLSLIIHSFWSSFINQNYPTIQYVLVSPVKAMLHNLIKHLKYENGDMIPITAGYAGDLEYVYNPTDENKNYLIRKYKSFLNYEKNKNIKNKFLEYLGLEQTDEGKLIQFLKWIEENWATNIDTTLFKYINLKDITQNQILNNDPSIFLDWGDTRKKWQNFQEENIIQLIRSFGRNVKQGQVADNKRLGSIDRFLRFRSREHILFPNPLDKYIGEDGEMIKITLENDTYLEIPYDTFTQFIKWSAASEFFEYRKQNNLDPEFWESPLLTIKLSDLARRWDEFENKFGNNEENQLDDNE